MSVSITSTVAGSGLDWQPLPPGAPAPAGTARAAAPTAAGMPDVMQQARIAARQLQEYLRQAGRDMQFTVDQTTGMTIVRIYNSATGELVRQIPGEEMVRIAQILRQETDHSTLSVKV